MTVFPLCLGYLQTNCYIMVCDNTNEAIIIDPCANEDIIINKIKELNLKVKYIILTHAHFDHTGALDGVKNYTNADIVIHTDENKALSDISINLAFTFGGSSPKSNADILVKDGDSLAFGSSDLTFLHTPGHTEGSMCIKVDNYLFSGDTLFYLSMGRTDLPGGNAQALSQSLNSLMELDENTIVYPGHGNKTTIGYEKANNPYIR